MYQTGTSLLNTLKYIATFDFGIQQYSTFKSKDALPFVSCQHKVDNQLLSELVPLVYQ